MKIEVLAFYKFTKLGGEVLVGLQGSLLALMTEYGVRGTIILAPDGVNSTIAGPMGSTSIVLNQLRELPELEDLKGQLSFAHTIPFAKAKVKIKKEILTFKEPNLPEVSQQTGVFVSPSDWNDLITDPSVTLIDTRNTYETEVGIFKNAIDPRIESFVEFKKYVKENMHPEQHRKVAMFCTGGIRCERASNYMLSEGFSEIYQLKGGITSYLKSVDKKDSLWVGDCFIFDDRRALDHDLKAATE